MSTYSITLCNREANSIEMHLSNLNYEQAAKIAYVSADVFRDMEIINEETGEVAFNSYANDEFFEKKTDYGNAIDRIMMIAEGIEGVII
jgi:hypothetical protein